LREVTTAVSPPPTTAPTANTAACTNEELDMADALDEQPETR
jgi:hypothetical protein